MFYQPCASREQLNEWILQILDWITPGHSDRSTLDAISASEITDLAYLEGVEFNTSIAAHALFPRYVEHADAQRGMGVTSSMEVIFPIIIQDDAWSYKIMIRAGRPSLLAIGQGGHFPRVNPDGTPPPEILSSIIDSTQFCLQEQGGERLQAIAGPMESMQWYVTKTITEDVGSGTEQHVVPGAIQTYAFIDKSGNLRAQSGPSGLQPLDEIPDKIQGFYLRRQQSSCTLRIVTSWKKQQGNIVLLKVALQNVSAPHGQGGSTRDDLLRSLILPHVRIDLQGARPDFPLQQYAEAKTQMLSLEEEERHDVSQQRLYQVRQSGCIATVEPADKSHVTMTTLGVFDTPRENPALGPSIADLTASPDSLLGYLPHHGEATQEYVHQNWSVIQAILQAAAAAFSITELRMFQWQAIAASIELEATGRQKVVTIVRAPTNAGKTVVFMVNAAMSSLCGTNRSTSMLLFPTRILNEDMFRRLTTFIYQIRCRLPDLLVTGGILMGTGDPLYRLLLNPKVGEPMHYYGECPACNESFLIAHPESPTRGNIATCPICNHSVDYMYNPNETLEFLPDIVIATPDKLFYEATVRSMELYQYGLLGMPVRVCQSCGRAHPDAAFQLKPDKTDCNHVFSKSKCNGQFSPDAISKPIRYMGFDEVHSLYGQTATYLSAFLALLEAMQRMLSGQNTLSIRYETATATIANETELLEALTRRHRAVSEIIAVPSDEQLAESFVLDSNSIRHRVLISLPSRQNSRSVFIRAALNSYRHLRTEDGDLKELLQDISSDPNAWDFLLGYVFKKQDGLDLRRALGDFYRNRFGDNLQIEFLSGDAPKNQISNILHQALQGELDLLLANLVISLGIDIHDLNHMIMFGVPSGFTEYVQTVGRTGRGNAPGHVSIILQPSASRDTYLYRHFHAILSDVTGYYDVLPVRSTNLYCSEEMFFNVTRGVLSARCLTRSQWPHRNGLNASIHGVAPQLKAGIVSILCNDTNLRAETGELVTRKFGQLLNLIQSQSKFLGSLMAEHELFLYSIRGRPGDTIKFSCTDELLLERLRALPQHDGSDVSEEESDSNNE